MSAHSLSMILPKTQLVGENYIDWKRNIMIVLTQEKLKFVLTDPCPTVPTAESSAEQKETYDKWTHSDEMARCYILWSISNVLQQKHQSMSTATEIIKSLRKMFDHQRWLARQAAIRSIMNMCMKLGTPVRDHMLALIAQFNVAEVLGAELESETHVDMTLETLPEMFSQFKVSYNMNKVNMSLTKLIKELQNAENVLKTKSSDAFAVTSVGPSSSKSKGNGAGFSGRQTKAPPTVPTRSLVSETEGDHVPIVQRPLGAEDENEDHGVQELVGEKQPQSSRASTD
ncbi:hypothetical protein DH2020_027233 [Rehmannia glutinosa]|uniref:Gag-pol polyprotein n=1 Tax=Rehmannia glutinosa TaxID=99300 RepID=A0ABR0VUP0_REHGL